MHKRLMIEQLKEGYNLIDESGEKYAVSESMLSTKVRAHFGLTKVKPKKEKNYIAPPAKVASLIASGEPEMQGNKTPDSHSGGAILMTKRSDPEEAGEEENTHRCEDISRSSSTEHSEKQPPQKSQVSADEMDKSKFGTLDNYIIMKPSDLQIPKFEYDKSKMQQYKSLSFQELPDGKAILRYGGAHYYTSKIAVMEIPYPFPKKYFSKENGWSSTVEQAFKMYRRYLAEQTDNIQERQMLQKPKQEDDWKYKPLLKTNTRTNYDGNKIEGLLER